MTLLLLALHVLAAVIWVGGMFFAHMFLRPAASTMELEPRVNLWCNVLSRFFPWIWGITLVIPLSGYTLLLTLFEPAYASWYIILMQGLGWSMISVFTFTFFTYYRKMKRMVHRQLIPEAGLYLNRIRNMVSINLILGIGTILIAVTGRFW
ncbi:MAG: hypothetical protein HQL90_01485 [Magnetococcales bacterium]|nr:hypothetical protein [Magnetococcales bacterium]